MGRIFKIATCCALIAGTTSAQPESTVFERFLELPAHERLQSTRQKTDTVLGQFTTDGCSGHQSQIWEFIATQIPAFAETHKEKPPWENCCITHDRAYHIGGFQNSPINSFDARMLADEKLYQCINKTAADRTPELSATYGMTQSQIELAYTAIAEAMFIAVRLGGAPCSGLPWRWGYGYQNCE